MLTETERHVGSIDPPGHVEAVGRGTERPFVAVRRRVEQHDPIVLAQLLPAELRVGDHGAPERLDRRDPAKALLHRGLDPRRVGRELATLVGMLRQRERGPRDEMAGRLIARDEQGQAVADGLRGAHSAPVDLCRREARHDVAGRRVAPGSDVIDEEAVERGEIVERGTLCVGRGDRRVGPAAEVVAVGVADSEQLGDHEDRKRRRQPIDEVDRLTGGDLAEQRPRRAAHGIGERCRRSGCETTAHELTPRRVEGRIHVQDRPVDLAGVAERIVHEHAPARAEPARILAHRAHVVVARDRPRTGFVFVDGRVATQRREQLVVVVAGEQARRLRSDVEARHHTNDDAASRPSSGHSPTIVVWRLHQPCPPPTGSSTRMTASRI